MRKWLCLTCNKPESWEKGGWESAPWMTMDEISKHLGEEHNLTGNDPAMKIALAGKVNITLNEINPMTKTEINSGLTVPLGDALLYVYTYSNKIDVLLWVEDEDLEAARAKHDEGLS